MPCEDPTRAHGLKSDGDHARLDSDSVTRSDGDHARLDSDSVTRSDTMHWLRTASTYLPLVGAIPILIVATFDSDVLKHIPLAALIAIVATSFIAIAAHLDVRLLTLSGRVGALESTQRSMIAKTAPVITVVSLGEGFALLRERTSRIAEMRVYAASSKDILAFTRFHGFSIDHCRLLIRGFDATDTRRHEAAVHARQVVSEWRTMQRDGVVRTLKVRSYDFMPTEFQVIFDRELMLTGLYASDPDDYRDVRVLDAVVVDGSTPSGREMILTYLGRYDSLFGVCASHHGPDIFNCD